MVQDLLLYYQRIQIRENKRIMTMIEDSILPTCFDGLIDQGECSYAPGQPMTT